MGMTMVEKILARATAQGSVKAGDVVEPRVDLAMSHENAALVLNQFDAIYEGTGLPARVWDPDRIAIIFDHRVPAESAKTAGNQKKVREFVEQQGIRKFHDIRGDVGGICHQVLPENGYVRPGAVVVGTDSHTTTHGALGAFAFAGAAVTAHPAVSARRPAAPIAARWCAKRLMASPSPRRALPARSARAPSDGSGPSRPGSDYR